MLVFRVWVFSGSATSSGGGTPGAGPVGSYLGSTEVTTQRRSGSGTWTDGFQTAALSISIEFFDPSQDVPDPAEVPASPWRRVVERPGEARPGSVAVATNSPQTAGNCSPTPSAPASSTARVRPHPGASTAS
jgi:hypothetical protein